MIYLEQGQKLADRPELVVYEPTGERADTDMVICAKAENPSEPFCWLEAQYIAYGGVVYKISDNAELEAEILKTDPDSTINDVVTNPVDANVVETTNPLDAMPQNVDPAHELNTSTLNQTQPVSSGTPTSATETQPVTPNADTTASSTPAVEPVIDIQNTNATSTETSTSTAPVVAPEPIPEPAPAVEPVVIPEPILETPSATTTDPVVTTRRRTKKNIS